MKKFGIALALALGLSTIIVPAKATPTWVSMAPITVSKAIANSSSITYYSESAYKLSQGTLVSVAGVSSAGSSSWFNRSNVKITSATKTTFTVNYANGPAVPITQVSVVLDGSTKKATYTTLREHNLHVGDLVAVSGFSPASLNTVANGIEVLAVADKTFTVATSAAVGQQIDSENSLEPAVSSVLNSPITGVAYAGTGTSKTITYTTRIPHGFMVGDKVAVNGVVPTTLNIKATTPKAISAVTTNTFTVPWTGTSVTQTVANRTSSAFSSAFLPASSLGQSGSATSAFSWENFHIVPADGLFETYHREYQSGFTAIYGASPSQHSVVYALADSTTPANSVKSITFRYTADASQIGKVIAFQFNAQSGVDDHDITGDFNAAYDGTDNTIDVVSDGSAGAVAEFTLTRNSDPFADADGNGDVLNAAFVAGNSVLGDMTVHWARPGFGPIIKLVGTSTSKLGNCDPSTSALSVHLCAQTGFRDETFDWSVANRAWFQEDSAYDYAQAWAKTYTAGDLVDMKYRVVDIWGNPIASHNVIFAVDSGKDAKWSKDGATLRTDSAGYVVFQTKNLNTAAQVAAHVDYNPDTGKPTAGILSFQVRSSLSPTNPGPECSDLIWFQLNSGAPIADTSANFKLQRIGKLKFALSDASVVFGNSPPTGSTDPSTITALLGDGTDITFTASNNFSAGDRVTVSNMLPSQLNISNAVILEANASSFRIACPSSNSQICSATTASHFGRVAIVGAPLPSSLQLDIDGETRFDIMAGQFSLVKPFNTFSYVYKGKRVSQPQELYNPNVTVTATNGGLAAVASAQQLASGFADFTDASSFRSTLVFGAPCYTGSCIQDIVFMGTKPGVTTWTISLGAWKRTFSMTYDAIPDDSKARFLKANQSGFAAVPNVNQTTTYSVVDRNGNAYANRPVDVSVDSGTIVSINGTAPSDPTSTTSTTDSNGLVTVISTSSTGTDQTVTVIATVPGTQMAEGEYSRFDAISGTSKTIAAGTNSAATTINFGKIVVKSALAKKAGANVLVWNAVGKKVTVKEGTKTIYTSANLTSAQQTISVPLTKGKHTLTISIPGMSPNVTSVVTAS